MSISGSISRSGKCSSQTYHFLCFFIYFYFHLFSLVALKSIQIVQQLQAPRATHMFVGENKMKWKFLWFPLPEFRCLNERDLLSNIKTDNEEQLKYWIRKVLFIACNCILCWRPQGHHELTCWAKIEPTYINTGRFSVLNIVYRFIMKFLFNMENGNGSVYVVNRYM